MPTPDFANSQTKENLMRAFAGESQARNRYTIAAGVARDQRNAVIEGLFLFTADQEKVHAKQFYKELSPLGGQNIPITNGNYPVDASTDLAALLRAAQHNEYQEFSHDYAHFAQVAQDEGFQPISQLFRNIAQVEQVHSNRFGYFAQLLEQGELFVSQVETQWICLHCGYTTNALNAPLACPVCKHPQGYFIRMGLSPYSFS